MRHLIRIKYIKLVCVLDRVVVRLVYTGPDTVKLKRCDMECAVRVGMEIVAQIVNILKYRPSSVSQNFATQKEPKLLSRRHTTVLS